MCRPIVSFEKDAEGLAPSIISLDSDPTLGPTGVSEQQEQMRATVQGTQQIRTRDYI